MKTQEEAEHNEVLELKNARDQMRNQLDRLLERTDENDATQNLFLGTFAQIFRSKTKVFCSILRVKEAQTSLSHRLQRFCCMFSCPLPF